MTALREEVAQLERFCGQLEDLAVAVELLEMEVRLGPASRCRDGGRSSRAVLASSGSLP